MFLAILNNNHTLHMCALLHKLQPLVSLSVGRRHKVLILILQVLHMCILKCCKTAGSFKNTSKDKTNKYQPDQRVPR